MKEAEHHDLSVMVWNVWFKTQINSTRLTLLTTKLDEYIDTHGPDVIGLHEVLTEQKTGRSAIISHLKQRGYYVESMPFSPIRNKWMTGNVVAYKNKPVHSGSHVLGPDTPAKWRGHDGHEIGLMHATLQTRDGKQVKFILNYLAHLVPYNWRTHIGHVKEFQKFIAQEEFSSRTVVVGDFNQFKWMLPLWNKRFHRRTGNIMNPTWRLQGKWPLQANYDNICWDKDGSLVLEKFRVLGKAPSDHAALMAKFTVR